MKTQTVRLEHFINGGWRASDDRAFRAHANPSDASDVVAEVPVGSAADVALAVDAAREALDAWRALPGPMRAEHLYRWAAAIADRHETIAEAMMREVGKPIAESRGETTRAVAILRYYAGEAVRAIGDVIPAQAPGALQFTLHEPLGVVALITPWNFPLAIPLWKTAPAIAFGNTVVLKPAEAASHTAVLLAEAAAAAGLPAGVFNVVLGTGATIGPALLQASEVRAVSFTGSGKVGAQVAATAAGRNIRYQTEMGGKNVAIVLPDADLRQAAALTAAGAFRYAGQKCTATSRAVVAREVEGPFLDELRRQIRALPLGPVSDPAAAVGPVISDASRTSILGALDGFDAEIVVPVPDAPEFARGHFVAPTIVRNAAADSALAQNELFGPVLATFAAEDLDHAIELANSTPYGLSASLFTRDIRSALRYVQGIQAGLVRVNGDTTGVDPHAPFGGMKGSSSGTREQGRAAREFYTEIKTVQINP